MIEVVAALIRSGGRFLICQRPQHKSRAGQWEFAGGKVEAGETLQQAIRREIREELKMDILPGRVVAGVEHDYADVSIHLSLLLADVAQGAPQLLEHSAMQWIRPEEAVNYEFCPADARLLEMLGENLNALVSDAAK